jgi:branched-chain amino acid transport system permease protein
MARIGGLDEDLVFFVSLLVDGALAGAIYALIALAFVVVYKSSRMINFALGEWAMIGSRLVAAGFHTLGLGVVGALGVAGLGMVGLALTFSRLILRPLVGQPLISFIMVTLGLGALMRGAAALLFRGIPNAIPLPIPPAPIAVHGLLISTEKLVAASLAAGTIAVVSWFFRRTRTGVALRAIADNQQAAMAVGVDLDSHFALTWAMVGVLSVLGGTLWTFVSGGGFGMVLVGLKVFPIVIIGGLDSIAGTIVGALIVGILESLASGYLDPVVGGGFSNVASYLVLIAVLFGRPHGLFGRPDTQRP